MAENERPVVIYHPREGRGGGEEKEGGISRPKNTKIMIVLTISLIHPVSNRIGA